MAVNDLQKSNHVQIARLERQHSAIGRITLNHPKALNALSLDMADTIQQALDDWAQDDSVRCIVIDGAGEKAFCAGGDIQAMYHDMQKNPDGPSEYTEAFFASEYRMDHALHNYSKPVIVWGDGIVMGGGLGIFMGGDFRLVSETTRIAMPEITIGLYPDVGASYFLNQLPHPIGRFLALTGAVIYTADCLALKLGSDYIERKHFDTLLAQLNCAQWAESKDENIALIQKLVTALSLQSKPLENSSNIEAHSDAINAIFSAHDVHVVINNFLTHSSEDKWLLKAQNSLKSGSPLGALIIDHQLKRSKNKSLTEVFQSEMILSTNIARFTEFSEGVRALLIEKDNSPNWLYSDHANIPHTFVESFFEAPWENNPLQDLSEI